jgi:hypothetical protein
MHRRWGAIVACVFLLVGAAQLHGQAGSATITGTVTDSTGALILGVSITVENSETGLSRATETNQVGIYNLPGLRPGSYTIRAETEGFRTHEQREFVVQVDHTSRLDIQLEVGQVTEVVEVTGEAQLLNTEDATVGAVIDTRRITDLPLNGRNFLELASLVPGVNTGQPTGRNSGRGGGISVNGNRHEDNAYQLDGVTNSDSWDNGIVFRPNVDSIQEFKIEVNNYSAEFGKAAGGQINVVTKSGTNEFHGAAYEFHRSDAVQARNVFQRDPNFVNSRGDFVAPPFVQNQFGVAVGGPIAQERAFFFADFEGFRQVRGQTALSSVPDATFKRGDFSGVLGEVLGMDALGRPVSANQIFDPLSSRAVGDALVRDPFPGNVVPTNRIASVPQQVLALGLWPDPNSPGSVDGETGSPQQNFFDSRSSRDDSDQFSFRVDQRFSDNDNFFTRYSFIDSAGFSPGSFPGNESLAPQRQQQLALSYTRALSPTLINEFRFGFLRSAREEAAQRTLDGVDIVGQFGIRGVPAANAGSPGFGVSDFTGIGDSGQSQLDNDTFQLIEQLSFNRGRHFFKVGFEFRTTAIGHTDLPGASRGGFGHDRGGWTSIQGFPDSGHAFADFLLGLPSGKYRVVGDFSTRTRSTEYGAYFQDDFKATSKLTINYGVRYQLYIPVKEERDHLTAIYRPVKPISFEQGGTFFCKDRAMCEAIDPNLPHLELARRILRPEDMKVDMLPQMLLAGRDLPRSLLETDKKNIGPRIGIAYRLRPSTVVRTGYGVFFSTSPIDYFENSVFNLPWTLEDLRNLRPFRFGLPNKETFFGFLSDNPGIQDLTPGGNSFEPDFKNPYIQNWNFGIQQQLSNDLVIEVGYAASKGTRLMRRAPAFTAEPHNDEAIIPTTVHPQLRFLFPFFVLNEELVTPGDWFQSTPSAFSNYHAALLRFEKRFSKGLAFVNAFTWSKAISDAQPRAGNSRQESPRPQNVLDWKPQKGLAALDHRYRWVSSFLYQLPFGKEARGALKAIMGGWELNGIVVLQSGYPITITRNGDPIGLGLGNTSRPDAVCNPNFARGGRSLQRYFDTDCLPVPDTIRFGNAGRAIIGGPGNNNWNLGLFKNFWLQEDMRLQFRAEFFNFFNHTQLGQPTETATSRFFGQVRGALDARITQFGLKLLW